MGYVRPERAKRPANRPKWPLQSLRRPVCAIRFFEIHDPGAFDEHFFNGLLDAATQGLGVAVLPLAAAQLYVQALDVALVRLTGADVERRLLLAMRQRAQLSNAALALVELVEA